MNTARKIQNAGRVNNRDGDNLFSERLSIPERLEFVPVECSSGELTQSAFFGDELLSFAVKKTAESKNRPRDGFYSRQWKIVPVPVLTLVLILMAGWGGTVRAAATPEDVFKSVQNNERDTIDGRKLLAVVMAGAAVVILGVLINHRQQRKELPRTLNHQGKLLRELMKSAGLKSAQIRQLKLLSQDLAAKNQPVESLVTLLLCPSLIKKSRDGRDSKR